MAEYVLVLNSSYEFLNIATVKRAIKLIFKGKAEVLETHPSKEIASSSSRIKLPSIIRMLYHIVRPFNHVPLTKKNILLRDRHTCQYCGKPGDTVDHILPKSRGGREDWTNCVCACTYCNTRKNNRTPEEANMKLLKLPRKPRYIPWILIKRDADAVGWEKYLYWNMDFEVTIETAS